MHHNYCRLPHDRNWNRTKLDSNINIYKFVLKRRDRINFFYHISGLNVLQQERGRVFIYIKNINGMIIDYMSMEITTPIST